MARVLLVAVLFALGATAQQLTVVPSTIQGVELVGPESPDFEALLTQIVGTDRQESRHSSRSVPDDYVVGSGARHPRLLHQFVSRGTQTSEN
jgi:hypothetical protein